LQDRSTITAARKIGREKREKEHLAEAVVGTRAFGRADIALDRADIHHLDDWEAALGIRAFGTSHHHRLNG
jgi:hypothetical protein